MSEEKDTLYARWLSGDLSAAELEALKASGELEELEAIVKATDEATLPAYDLKGALAELKSNRKKVEPKGPRLRLAYVAGMAASLLVLLIAFFLFRNNDTLIAADDTTTRSFTFADASTVVLNDGSQITYSDSDWSEQRNVKLKGEAFFTVTKGLSFIVETDNGTVEVLGTEFNVRAWGNGFRVECFEGRVRVITEGKSVELGAMQAIGIEGGNLTELISISHQQPFWTADVSRFYAEDLNEVLEEIGRQFGVEIQAPQFNKYFTGQFDHNKLETALNTVARAMNLNYVIEPGNLVVIQAED